MGTESKYVVGIGEALWDILPEGKKIGGAPANFAYHVSQFGLESRVVSAVGDDALGEEILMNFRKKNLQCMVPKVAFPTGTVQVTVDDAGIPCYDIRQNVAWDNIPFTEELRRLAGRTCAVCFGSLAQRSEVSRNTVRSFLEAMPDGDDIYRVFDINLRQNFYTQETVRDSLDRCNILKINDEEFDLIKRLFHLEGDSDEVCRHIMSRWDLRLLILTAGAQYSSVYSGDGLSRIRTPEVEVADTVGAGDSFTGSFIGSVLNGKSVREAHEAAVKTAAEVCRHAGAWIAL